MNKINEAMNSAYAKGVATVAVMVGFLMAGTGAFATTLNPTTDVTSFANSNIAKLYPIVLAVAGAVVVLIVLRWGINKVLRILKGRHGSI